VKREM